MRLLACVWTTIVIAGGLAGCLGDANDETDPAALGRASAIPASPEKTLVEDPSGDAQRFDVKGAAEATGALACPAGVPACGILPAETFPSAGGIPVHAAFDILRGAMAEAPETLTLAITVAELPRDLEGVLEPGQGAFWDISWSTPGGGTVNAYLAATLRENGHMDIGAQVEEYCADTDDGNVDCYEGANWWWWASSTIDHEIEYGAPGTIRLHVPRDALSRAGQADILELKHVGTGLVDDVPGYGMIHYGVEGAGPYEGGTLWSGVRDAHVDEANADPPARFTFETAQERWHGRDSAARTEHPVATPENAYEDVLATVVSDTPQTFAIKIEMAQVDEAPVDHDLAMFFSFDRGPVYMAGLDVRDGKRTPWTSTGSDPEHTETVHVPVQLHVQTGTPGAYTFTYDRKDLNDPAFDQRLNMLWAYPSTSQAGVSRNVGDLSINAHERSSNDLLMAQTYWIQTEAADPLPDGETANADDARFDTATPPMADDTSVANFDITQVTVTGIQPDLTRVTLDMRELDEVVVPVGYDAAFYAVAFETERGPVMIGYRQDTADRQDWFCSPDVAVFADEPSDPLGVARTPIQGGLRQGARDTAPGFVFFVPHTCLGVDAAGPVTVDRWAAGSFLVQDPGGATQVVTKVDAVDAAQASGPAIFGVETTAAEPLVPAAAWYAEPFGISNFWDITGLGVALLLAIGGAVLVWRRRRLLARYLHEVDQAERIKDARARETVLSELRGRLRADLTKGRLPESHFMLVDKRIEALVGKARSTLFAETFGDLPHRLVGRLEAILADGVITRDELEAASTLVRDARIPAREKQRVLAKLADWDLEDALVRT